MLSKLLPSNLSLPSWLNKVPWLQKEDDALSTWRRGIVLGVLGITVSWFIWRRYDSRNLPPGPIDWPFVGSKQLRRGGTLCAGFSQLSREYGDVFSVGSGRKLKIILNSHAAVKEALVLEGDTFACRPIEMGMFVDAVESQDDIFSTPYQTPGWNANKNMLTTCLRSAGFGKAGGIEDKMLEQVELLLPLLDGYAKSGEPLNVLEILPKATTNVIFQILMNKKHEYDDPKLEEIVKVINEFMLFLSEIFKMQGKPKWVKKLFHRKTCRDVLVKTDAIREIIRAEVELHKATHNPDEPRDFIDLYLTKSGGEHAIGRIVDNILMFIPDACDTMVMMLSWLILYVTYYADVQKKAADEIEEVTCGNRLVTWADRPQLAFTEATIMEIIRLQPTVSFTVPHTVDKDVIFRGFRIPANVWILGNIFAAHRDPAVYDNPDEFKPERFLDAEGRVIRNDKFLPFSMGRRKCPGEQITRMETFLVMANIIQKYQLTFADGEKPELKGTEDIINIPPVYKVKLTARK